MSLMRSVELKIKALPEGKLITYDDFGKYKENFYALSKALSRLNDKGVIERYKKGVYYKPKETIFGKIGPSEKDQINLILSDKSINGYLSGSTIYNDWGLTTQVSNEIVIVTNNPPKNTKLGNLKIKYSKGISPKVKSDVRKLQLLDIIKNFKKIPDRDDQLFVSVVKNELRVLEKKEVARLIKLALSYNPATRALLGALLDSINFKTSANTLKSSLNSFTGYKINISIQALPNKKDWQIV